MLSPEEKFRQYLAGHGKGWTKERSQIVSAVFFGNKRFDIDELVAELDKLQDGLRVSRAAVYRTVSLLEKARLVKNVGTENDRVIYEALD